MKAPIPLPSSGMSGQYFEPQRVDYSAATADARVGGVQAGWPLWLAIYSTGTIGQRKSDEVRAFMARIRGAIRWILARPLDRPFPLAHINGFAGLTRPDSSPFDGSALTWLETITSDEDSEITLTGLPPGLQGSIGDYIDFVYPATDAEVAGLEWHVPVRLLDDATADETGVMIVACEPPVHPAVPAGAVAHLDNPRCVMRLLSDQSKLGSIDRRLAIKDGTIACIQDIRS
jgi:hypothetical protein